MVLLSFKLEKRFSFSSGFLPAEVICTQACAGESWAFSSGSADEAMPATNETDSQSHYLCMETARVRAKDQSLFYTCLWPCFMFSGPTTSVGLLDFLSFEKPDFSDLSCTGIDVFAAFCFFLCFFVPLISLNPLQTPCCKCPCKHLLSFFSSCFPWQKNLVI